MNLPIMRLQAEHAACFTLVSCLAYSSTFKTEASFTSETSVVFRRATQRYISGDRTLHNDRCENLISTLMMMMMMGGGEHDTHFATQRLYVPQSGLYGGRN